jgi:hypothetical protein
MKRYLLILCGITLLLFVVNCSKSSSTNSTPLPDLFVDVLNQSGVEDGSEGHPYNTISEAIAVAVPGQVIFIDSGTYEEIPIPLYIKAGITLRGQTAATTIIATQLSDSCNSILSIVIENLTCQGFLFNRAIASGTPTAFNIIRNCIVYGDIELLHGGNHKFIISNNEIHGSIDVAHGQGTSVNIIKNNGMVGSISLMHGACITDTVSNNTIAGGDIVDRSGQCNTYIIGNAIAGGRIIDRSGQGIEIIRDNTITFVAYTGEPDSAGIKSAGSSATIIRNQINVVGGDGIYAISGSPTIIDSNTIAVNGVGIGLYTVSGTGEIIGNTITGGLFGIYDQSGATLVSYNFIDSAETGVYASGAGRYSYNTITHCTSDGMVLHGVRGPIEGNTINNNQGYGILIQLGAPDLGGGADNCIGGNRLLHNVRCDLLNWTANPIKAENNQWDHNDAAGIDSEDIIDDEENANYGQVDFEPFQ